MQRPNLITGIFNPQTYLNIVYLFLTFPLGLLYFLFFVIGVSLGAGLAVILVGIPILIGVVMATPTLAEFESQLARSLLGAQIEREENTKPKRGDSSFKQLFASFLSPQWWRSAVYLGLKFPLGLMTFIITVTTTAFVGGLILSPFGFSTVEIMGWEINTFGESLIGMVAGLIAAPFALMLLNIIAGLWRVYTEQMLNELPIDDYVMGKAKAPADDYDYPNYFEDDSTSTPRSSGLSDPIGRPPMRNRFLQNADDEPDDIIEDEAEDTGNIASTGESN